MALGSQFFQLCEIRVRRGSCRVKWVNYELLSFYDILCFSYWSDCSVAGESRPLFPFFILSQYSLITGEHEDSNESSSRKMYTYSGTYCLTSHHRRTWISSSPYTKNTWKSTEVSEGPGSLATLQSINCHPRSQTRKT